MLIFMINSINIFTAKEHHLINLHLANSWPMNNKLIISLLLNLNVILFKLSIPFK
jgi:hypothetical protein